MHNRRHMLGNFLELSISADPIEPAMQFYRSLGFQELVTGDFVSEPYAAFWDGSANIGLYTADFTDPILSFVRPELREHARALRHFGIIPDEVALEDDAFHRVSFCDSSSQRVALLEARTYSGSTRTTGSISPCGEFLEYALPTHSVEESTEFWGALGLSVVTDGSDPHPWVRMSGHGFVVGFHQARMRPGLSYRAGDLVARTEYLRARGIDARPGAPMARRRHSAASLEDSNGVAIYLLADTE